jgi:hypothetical protein
MHALKGLPAKRRAQVRGVNTLYSIRTRLGQMLKAVPFAQPKKFFLNRTHCPLSSPHASAPKRMLHFKGFDERQEIGIALKLSLVGSPPVTYQSFFYSSASSPTSSLSFWLPAVRRSSRRFVVPASNAWAALAKNVSHQRQSML